MRFGRVPKNEKDRISSAMKAAQNKALPPSPPYNQSYKEHILLSHNDIFQVIGRLVREVIRQAHTEAREVTPDWVSTQRSSPCK